MAEPFVDRSDIWNRRLVYFLRFVKLNTSQRFFNLFLRFIRTGVLDKIQEDPDYFGGFWHLIYDLPEQKPDWACQAIGCYLNRCLNLSIDRGQTNPFDRTEGITTGSRSYTEAFSKSVQLDPKSFVENILPFMLRVMELTAYQKGNLPWIDPVWYHRSYGLRLTIKDELLYCMEAALASLAINNSDCFSEIVAQQLRNSNYETIQYLLIRAYTANCEILADEAVNYLCEQPTRLKTGYSVCTGNIHVSPYWATRQLLEVIVPYCSERSLRKLEKLILNYYPRIEKELYSQYWKWILNKRGYEQFILLDAIPSSHRSETVNRRIQEWKRKFISVGLLDRSGEVKPPKAIKANIVDSPIPRCASPKMTDKQWLKIITQYQHDDAGSWFERHGELVGGGSSNIAVSFRTPSQKRTASLCTAHTFISRGCKYILLSGSTQWNF